MASGIVSSALLLTHHSALSVPVLVVACVLWVDLAGILAERMVVNPAEVRREEHMPAALTGVAGTAVLGARFTLGGAPAIGWVALAVAGGLWLWLVRPVLSSLPRHGVAGAAFLLTVATASLAALLGGLSRAEHVRWLVVPGVVLIALALLLYLDVLRRFAARQELTHGRGDQWVAGGALAICVLASAALARACTGSGFAALRDAALVLAGLAVAWLPVLVAGELIHPRLAYDQRRWATVFPLGMYSAAGATLGTTLPSQLLTDAAGVWVWIAVAAWLVVLAGLLRRAATTLAGVPARR
jgi:tellurite resistance protein TehA-like permease